MKCIFFIFLFFFHAQALLLAQADGDSKLGGKAPENPKLKEAQSFLKQSLQNYKQESFKIPIKQDIFLSMINTNLTSQGFVFVKGQRFRLDLKGKPSSLSVFDGNILWHQPDTTEKTVFKLEQAESFQILNQFFDSDLFFKNYSIKKFKNLGKTKIYYLDSKNNDENLKELYLKTKGNYIVEIHLTWKDVKSWQRYRLSKPLKQKLSDSLFAFNPETFKVFNTPPQNL